MRSFEERTIDWADGAVVIIDQCALPGVYRKLRLSTVDELIGAIQRLAVRGAPALGAAGALGVVLAVERHGGDLDAVRADARRVAEARPTAVNLSWGVGQVLPYAGAGFSAVLERALEVLAEDERLCRAASGHAASFILERCGRRPVRLLTHCNAGSLATVSWGSALGVVWHLLDAGKLDYVLVDETRPLLQGARLTAWELERAGVDYRVLPDVAAASALARGMVDAVIVGADRIAANGDVANKVGTYGLAVVAARHEVPFVVVAPSSTVDRSTASGGDIVIEERSASEVLEVGGVTVAPVGSAVFNPAFDVTPVELVSAVVTEDGPLRF